MQHDKVFKKVEARLGITPTKGYNGKYSVCYGNKIGEWYHEARTGEACSFHIRRIDDIPDSMTDYFPGWYPGNITQMLDNLKPPPPKFAVGALVRGKQNKRAIRHGFAGKVGLVQENSSNGQCCKVFWDGVPGETYISDRDLELVK